MTFNIVKFYTKYETRNGAVVPIDMVDICPPGAAQRSTTPLRISEISRVIETPSPDNSAANNALARWQRIRPAFEAWKAGQEMPVNGTPLAVWPGVTPEQAEILRNNGIKSVEDIASATDGVIGRVPLPGMRDLQANARRFLDSRDQNAVAIELAKKDREMAELREQLEEMRQIVLQQSQAGEDLEADGSERPKRRGRPPKVHAEAGEAA